MSDVWEWIDADGTVHAMSTSGAKVLKGMVGRGMPPVEFVESEVPFQPGTRLRTAKTKARDLAVPMLFQAATAADLQTALRSWLYALNADRGDGLIRYTGPDGVARVLACRYSDGMQFAEDAANRIPTWQRVNVLFRAFDPYWYDASALSFGFSAEDAPLFFPFFPLVLGAASVFSGMTITNDGDVDGWPVWRVKGPGVNLTLRNLTTGKSLTLTTTLVAGDQVEIDTRPGAKSVTLLATGGNLYGELASGSSLWPLQVGANQIRVEMDSTTGDSQVTMMYQRRWLGA